jgi:hypothetical protein
VECLACELLWIPGNMVNGAVELIEKRPSNPLALPWIPAHGSLGLVDSRGMHPDLADAHGLSGIVKATPRLIPANQVHGSAVDLLPSLCDLLAPGLFCVLTYFRVQTFGQRPDQGYIILACARLTITRAYTS